MVWTLVVVTGGEKLASRGDQSGCPETGKVKEEPFIRHGAVPLVALLGWLPPKPVQRM